MSNHSPSDSLFDLQVNGFGGVDFQRDGLTAAELQQAVATLRAHGTGRIFLTLITDEIDALCRRLEHIEALCARDADAAAMVVGYHLEGPWLSPEPGYCGAHRPEPMHAPCPAELDRLQQAAGGRLRLITLAPEWPGSEAFIADAVGRGIHVSLGHTNASDAQIAAAIGAGARFCTHLGNAVPQFVARHDNIMLRLLARDELTACLIPDGTHLPPGVLQSFFRAKPPGRVLFTTDAMAGAGAPPGRYSLAHHTVEVGADRIARLPGAFGYVGSTLTPEEGVANVARHLQLAPAEARRLWSKVPAAAFGLPDRPGCPPP